MWREGKQIVFRSLYEVKTKMRNNLQFIPPEEEWTWTTELRQNVVNSTHVTLFFVRVSLLNSSFAVVSDNIVTCSICMVGDNINSLSTLNSGGQNYRRIRSFATMGSLKKIQNDSYFCQNIKLSGKRRRKDNRRLRVKYQVKQDFPTNEKEVNLSINSWISFKIVFVVEHVFQRPLRWPRSD